MAFISNNFRVWLHGLLAAAIGSFATAAAGMLVLPNDFNLSHEGLIKMAKLTLVPTGLQVFAYLKQSPVPKLSPLGPGDTATLANPVVSPDGKISGTSATLTKADNPENGQK